jgi:RNA polymerase sigma-70 factor (ECF subfamily)
MATTPPLITAAQAGDREAIAALYQQHQPAVRGYLARRCPADLADDLAQDVWVRALRALPAYRWTGRPLEAWLITIARNLLADHGKRSSSQREVPLGDQMLEDPAGPLLEDQVLAKLDAAPVRAAVEQLPAVHRQTLILTHWTGLTTTQIAAHTGRTPGAVRCSRHRAGAALRRQLTAA